MTDFVPRHVTRLSAYEPGRSAEEVAREFGLERVAVIAEVGRAFFASGGG